MANWKEVVGQLAPKLGTALGGPLGNMAGRLVAGALGVSPDSKEGAIAEAVQKMTPEQLASLKAADQAFEAKMAELGIDLEKVNAADRASARDMQKVTRNWVPGAIATLLHVLLCGLLAVLAWHPIPPENKDAFMLALGMVATGTASVWGFYFGSSSGSQAKDVLLGRAAAKA
jgi:hypothetical protein